MPTLSCVKERDDCRVAMTPATAFQFIKMGFDVQMEEGAGKAAGYDDMFYKDVSVLKNHEKLLEADIVLSVRGLDREIKGKSISINGAYGLRLDRLPRITRAQSMDVLSSQNNLSGYQAVIEGTLALKRVIPLMMTAAGTIQAARVLILGVGVAGLQAIATAKRLGAVVSAFDVRSSAKEQVESLGASFIEVDMKESGDGQGGYAKEMSEEYKKAQNNTIKEIIAEQDIVITSALIPGKKAPTLIDQDMVDVMKPGSVIMDLAGEAGGNCALSRYKETITTDFGVKIICPKNILDSVAFDASQLYAKNIYHFIKMLFSVENQNWREEDVLFHSCVC